MALYRTALTTLSLVLLAGARPIGAQGIAMPALRAGDQSLAIETLGIHVQVVGSLATTTWDLTFRNPQGRILEGELVFPLGEGQTVSRFALPVNGQLREGVVVEKAKGRVAFEDVVRRPTVVDPGLLEKTEGNAFRTRVYPIPALGTYRVVIAYEQELQGGSTGLRYHLPLAFAEPVGTFTFRVELQEQAEAPRLAGLGDLTFQNQGRGWWAEHRSQKVRLNQTLELALPRTAGQQAVFLHGEGVERFFHVHLDALAPRAPKVLPRRLLVVWDASGSAAKRDLLRERTLLAAYLKRLGTVSVDLAVLRNDVAPLKRFHIQEGHAKELLDYLTVLPLDGGTRLDALALKHHRTDEVLFFGDGLGNLGKAEPQLPAAPLTSLSSAPVTNHALLRQLAESSGGEHLNLGVMKDAAVLEALVTRPYAFLGCSGAPGAVHDVHPAKGAVVRGAFGLSGRLIGDRATITLRFGYGKAIKATRTVVLDAGRATATPLAARLWAQKKLADLEADPEANRAEILALGRQHGLVTNETSLIVLETVQDYVRHRIGPPSELRAEYDAAIRSLDQQKRDARAEQISDLSRRFETLKAWWKRDVAPSQKSVPPREVTSRGTSRNSGWLLGTVREPNGRGIAGAVVRIDSMQGQDPRTVTTDAEGSYRMPLLLPGEYVVRAERSGFIGTRGHATVRGDQGMRLDLTLRPASVAGATVEVIAAPDAAPDTAVQGSGTVVQEQLPSLPVPRDLATTASLAPGLVQPQRDTSTVVEVVASSAVLDKTEVRTAVNISMDGMDTSDAAQPTRTSIQLAAWQPDTPYLKALREVAPSERYAAYLNLRKAYGAAPGFYLDVADALDAAKDAALALRVLSNLAELNLDAPALLRVLGHRLLQRGETALAIQVFTRVVRLREEEPQSHRDLALALAAGGQHQQAADLLYDVATRTWDNRFAEVDLIVLNELNALVARHRINTQAYDRRLLAALPVDVRVVLTWDTNDSDMDLHVTDPNGEICNFGHNQTALGGRLSRDITQGYGPEEFLLKRAIPGTYRIQANYFGTRQQTAVVGPTTLKATLFTHYGSAQEQRKELILRLDGRGSMVDVGTFDIR